MYGVIKIPKLLCIVGWLNSEAMSYCPECGSEIKEDAKFCPDCGASLQSDAESVDISSNNGEVAASEHADGTEEEQDGLNTGRAIASGIMGLVVGAVVAFAFTNIGGSSVLFLITLAGVGYFLYSNQETVRLVIGTGLYITALWMPLAPIIFYIPLAGNANSETAAGAGQAIGSVLGMFIYGFIGLIIGIVLAAIGYFVRKGERE